MPDTHDHGEQGGPDHSHGGQGGSDDGTEENGYCFTGSTEFYSSPETDQFTPSYLEAGLLVDNVATRNDGTIPPWFKPGSPISPIQQYVEWFNGIWHSGDPSSWNETVFTTRAVMIDPTGFSVGAKQAAASFLLLFKYYPELRGEVVSWCANNREIFLNWRFCVKPRDGSAPLLVPVVDKFCFLDGRVSHRLAYFDILTLIGYLAENYGQSQLTDFLRASIVRAEATGGIQNVPRLIWTLVKGLFVWAADVDMLGLKAQPSDGFVSLTWDPVPNAVSYRINRSTDLSGPFKPPPPGDAGAGEVMTNSYIDTNVTNGVTYWYIVSPTFDTFVPMPIVPIGSAESRRVAAGKRDHRHLPYGVSRGDEVEAVPAEGVPYSHSVAGHGHQTKTPHDN